jgi:hypothetical protein
MRHWYDTGYKWPGYYNFEMLQTPYGTLTEYAPLVLENDETDFYRRKHVFPELVEAV